MRIAAALFVLVLAACAPAPTEYPADIEMNFMTACEAQSRVPGLCRCTWGKIVAEVPPGDFMALERLPGPDRAAHPLTSQINNYALACGQELLGEQTPAP